MSSHRRFYGLHQLIRNTQERAVAGFQGLRLGLGTKELRHALLVCQGESIIFCVEYV